MFEFLRLKLVETARIELASKQLQKAFLRVQFLDQISQLPSSKNKS